MLLEWLQNLYVPFSTKGPFKDVQVTHAMGTNTPKDIPHCKTVVVPTLLVSE